MSKPALGRGLGGLMEAPPRKDFTAPIPGAVERHSGIQLLLRGENGQPIAPPPPDPSPSEYSDVRPVLPSWSLGCLLLADGLLMTVGAWIILASRAPGHWWVGSLVILLGGGLLALGVWLRGERGAVELQSFNPLDTPAPKVRVQFLDERR